MKKSEAANEHIMRVSRASHIRHEEDHHDIGAVTGLHDCEPKPKPEPHTFLPGAKVSPSNRTIWANFHQIPIPFIAKEYGRIMKKESRLPKAQRDMIIAKFNEYVKLGIVKVEPVYEDEAVTNI